MKMTDEFNMPVKISKHESKPSWYILDNEETLICSVLDESEAKYIANAINFYDDMYMMIEEILEMQKKWYGYGMDTHINLSNLAIKMKLLLAKSRGEHNGS